MTSHFFSLSLLRLDKLSALLVVPSNAYLPIADVMESVRFFFYFFLSQSTSFFGLILSSGTLLDEIKAAQYFSDNFKYLA